MAQKTMETKTTKAISVIIVEDFKLTRVGLRCALNANDDINVVAEAEDAVEGLKLIEKHKPDVILMDLGLPGMNGIEAMIKCKEMMFDSKIIALTSHDRSEEVIAALSSGASAYCLKDIDPQKLADVVRDVSTGVCWIDPMVAQMTLNALPKIDNIGFLPNKTNTEGRVPLTEREFEVLKHLVSGKAIRRLQKNLLLVCILLKLMYVLFCRKCVLMIGFRQQ